MTIKKHAALLLVACISGAAFGGATLDRIRDSGHIRLAYLPGGKPFTSPGSGGTPEGYGVELCSRVAGAGAGRSQRTHCQDAERHCEPGMLLV